MGLVTDAMCPRRRGLGRHRERGITDSVRHLFLSLSAAGKVAIIDIVTRTVVGEIEAGATPDGIGYSALTVTP